MVMTNYQKNVRRVIGEYIRPDHTLVLMERIHQDLTGRSEDFHQWEDVEKKYMQMDWDGQKYIQFLEIAREHVEGDTETVSESYFDIVEPEEEIGEVFKKELQAREVQEDPDLGVDEGFSVRERDDGVLEATYHFATVSTEITAEPDIKRQPTPKSISFRIKPEEELMVVETTFPAHVQKIGSIISGIKPLEVAICGDVTKFPDSADEKVISFINEFRDEEKEIPYE